MNRATVMSKSDWVGLISFVLTLCVLCGVLLPRIETGLTFIPLVVIPILVSLISVGVSRRIIRKGPNV